MDIVSQRLLEVVSDGSLTPSQGLAALIYELGNGSSAPDPRSPEFLAAAGACVSRMVLGADLDPNRVGLALTGVAFDLVGLLLAKVPR